MQCIRPNFDPLKADGLAQIVFRDAHVGGPCVQQFFVGKERGWRAKRTYL